MSTVLYRSLPREGNRMPLIDLRSLIAPPPSSAVPDFFLFLVGQMQRGYDKGLLPIPSWGGRFRETLEEDGLCRLSRAVLCRWVSVCLRTSILGRRESPQTDFPTRSSKVQRYVIVYFKDGELHPRKRRWIVLRETPMFDLPVLKISWRTLAYSYLQCMKTSLCVA